MITLLRNERCVILKRPACRIKTLALYRTILTVGTKAAALRRLAGSIAIMMAAPTARRGRGPGRELVARWAEQPVFWQDWDCLRSPVWAQSSPRVGLPPPDSVPWPAALQEG